MPASASKSRMPDRGRKTCDREAGSVTGLKRTRACTSTLLFVYITHFRTTAAIIAGKTATGRRISNRRGVTQKSSTGRRMPNRRAVAQKSSTGRHVSNRRAMTRTPATRTTRSHTAAHRDKKFRDRPGAPITERKTVTGGGRRITETGCHFRRGGKGGSPWRRMQRRLKCV